MGILIAICVIYYICGNVCAALFAAQTEDGDTKTGAYLSAIFGFGLFPMAWLWREAILNKQNQRRNKSLWGRVLLYSTVRDGVVIFMGKPITFNGDMIFIHSLNVKIPATPEYVTQYVDRLASDHYGVDSSIDSPIQNTEAQKTNQQTQ